MTRYKSAAYDERFNPPKKRISETGYFGRMITQSEIERWLQNYQPGNSNPTIDFDQYDKPADLLGLPDNIIVKRSRTIYEIIREEIITLDEMLGKWYDNKFGERKPLLGETGELSGIRKGVNYKKISGNL